MHLLIENAEKHNLPVMESDIDEPNKNNGAVPPSTTSNNLKPTPKSSIRNKDMDINKALLVEIDVLKNQLKRKQNELETALLKPTNTVEVMFEKLSKEEADKILPEPYSGIAASVGGSLIEYLNKHTLDEIDYEWGPMMEQNITDFVYMHPQSLYVELQLVTCKTSTCEIRVVENNKRAWSLIDDDMSEQSWYKFSGVASSGDTIESIEYVYIMMSL